MKIVVTHGVGRGPTPLAAFDAALLASGVENYNLITLSSVIPPGATIECSPYKSPPAEYGHRLYVVMAQQRATREGEEAWAGVGWTQDEGDGRGLFVECEGTSEGAVRSDIESTLEAMIASRDLAYGPIRSEVSGIRCCGEHVCALVLAVYESEGCQ